MIIRLLNFYSQYRSQFLGLSSFVTSISNRLLHVILAVILIFTSATYSTSVLAKPALQLKPASYKQLLSSQKALEAKQYAKAEQLLLTLIKNSQSLKYDQLIGWRNLAAVYLDQAASTDAASEKNTDQLYKQAIPALKNALELALDLKQQATIEQQQLRLNLGQLLLQQQNYAKSAQLFKDYLSIEEINLSEQRTNNTTPENKIAKTTHPAARIYLLLAQAEYQQQHWLKVLSPISKAIEAATEQQLPAQKNWYQIKLAAFYQLKQSSKMKSLLQQMLKLWPNERQYWMQLYQIELQQSEPSGQQANVLAVLKSAWLQGVFDRESDYLQLVQLLAYNNNAYQAGQLLEQSIQQERVPATAKNYRHLANYWLMAKEGSKAISALKLQFQIAPQEKLALTISQLLFTQQQYSSLVDFANNYLDSTSLNSTLLNSHSDSSLSKTESAVTSDLQAIPKIQLLIAQAYWQLSQTDTQSDNKKSQLIKKSIHLLQIVEGNSSTKQTAKNWLKHIKQITDTKS